MSKVLITYERGNNTTDVNLASFRLLFSHMSIQWREKKTTLVSHSDLLWCDVCLAIRPNSVYSQRIAEVAKKTGIFYIVSFDDDLLNLPSSHPEEWKKKYSLFCLKYAKAVISPNPLILNDYYKYSPDAKAILTNAIVEDCEIKAPHIIGNKLRIVYPAGRDHLELFNKYIKPILYDILAKYHKEVDITIIGVEPKLDESEYKNFIHLIKGMSYEEYSSYMKNHDFDIGLAPLGRSSFAARKYFAKYIEYAKYGIMGLYSDTMPYTLAVKDGINGVLVADSALAWRYSLIRIIHNKNLIDRIVFNSQQNLRDKHSIDSMVTSLRNSCAEIEYYSKSGEDRIIYRRPLLAAIIYNCRDFYERVKYHYRYEGVKSILNRIVCRV